MTDKEIEALIVNLIGQIDDTLLDEGEILYIVACLALNVGRELGVDDREIPKMILELAERNPAKSK